MIYLLRISGVASGKPVDAGRRVLNVAKSFNSISTERQQYYNSNLMYIGLGTLARVSLWAL